MAMTLAQRLVLQFHYRYCTVSVLLLLTNLLLSSPSYFSLILCLIFKTTFYFQSQSLSGTTWYNLSSLQIGLVVISLKNFYITFSLLLINNQVVNHYLLILFQVSGSLYGALIGSALAFAIADFLGFIPSSSKFFTVNIYYLGEMIYDSC